MRSLRERLAQFDRPRDVDLAPKAPPEGDPLAALLEEGATWMGTRPSGHLRLEADVDESVQAPFDAVTSAAWSLYARSVPEGEHWVVLDTETTGLESGTGMLVFLVGIVHWTSRGLRRVQLMLPEPAGEASLLDALDAELQGVDALLSYNGRSFDVPRLRARLQLQRRDTTIFDRPHLDLLHPARRILRGTLPDLRLGTLERELLGRPRHDDLPGEFAPEVYRSLLADHRDEGLGAVVLHNARDVERLPALASWLGACVGESPPEKLAPAARLAAARLHAERGDPTWAERTLRGLLDDAERLVRHEAHARLAGLLRRQERFDEAARLWQAVVDERPGDLRAHVELAKLYEHRLGDLDEAQRAVLGALRSESDRRALGLGGEEERRAHGELTRRLARIRRKMSRRSPGA